MHRTSGLHGHDLEIISVILKFGETVSFLEGVCPNWGELFLIFHTLIPKGLKMN